MSYLVGHMTIEEVKTLYVAKDTMLIIQSDLTQLYRDKVEASLSKKKKNFFF